jgi:hypothetical protein
MPLIALVSSAIEPVEEAAHLGGNCARWWPLVVHRLAGDGRACYPHGLIVRTVLARCDGAQGRVPMRKQRTLPTEQALLRERAVPVGCSVLHDVQETLDVSWDCRHKRRRDAEATCDGRPDARQIEFLAFDRGRGHCLPDPDVALDQRQLGGAYRLGQPQQAALLDLGAGERGGKRVPIEPRLRPLCGLPNPSGYLRRRHKHIIY